MPKKWISLKTNIRVISYKTHIHWNTHTPTHTHTHIYLVAKVMRPPIRPRALVTTRQPVRSPTLKVPARPRPSIFIHKIKWFFDVFFHSFLPPTHFSSSFFWPWIVILTVNHSDQVIETFIGLSWHSDSILRRNVLIIELKSRFEDSCINNWKHEFCMANQFIQ